MAQDYAKQRMPTGVRRKPSGRAATKMVPAAQTSHWSWYFSGLMSGVIVAIVAYLGILKLDAETTETLQIVQAAEDPVEEPTFNFGFYKNLENAEVAVSPPPVETPPAAATPAAPAPRTSAPATATATAPASVAAPPAVASATPVAAPAATEEKQSNYLLQVGSFQNRQDAESHRARLIMLNLDASIVPAVVSGRTVQRVLVGPFNSRASAEESREMLSENGIDSMPLLMR